MWLITTFSPSNLSTYCTESISQLPKQAVTSSWRKFKPSWWAGCPFIKEGLTRAREELNPKLPWCPLPARDTSATMVKDNLKFLLTLTRSLNHPIWANHMCWNSGYLPLIPFFLIWCHSLPHVPNIMSVISCKKLGTCVILSKYAVFFSTLFLLSVPFFSCSYFSNNFQVSVPLFAFSSFSNKYVALKGALAPDLLSTSQFS